MANLLRLSGSSALFLERLTESGGLIRHNSAERPTGNRTQIPHEPQNTELHHAAPLVESALQSSPLAFLASFSSKKSASPYATGLSALFHSVRINKRFQIRQLSAGLS